MGARISLHPFCLVAALILCFASVSLSSLFSIENPIRVLSSDGIHGIHDDALSFAPRLTSKKSTIRAIYQFGDSISDTGNFMLENPSAMYAKSPYGETFFHEPAGRASDGLLMIDYFTKFFNMPFLDPYLSKDGNFSHGVNFAVAGASALNISTLIAQDVFPSNVTNSSLLVQIGWFKSYLNTISSTASDYKEKLANSLIIMGEIGGNDYNWVLNERSGTSKVYDMVPEVVQMIKNAVKEVINLGAIKIVVPGNFPVGCLGVMLALYKTNDSRMYDELLCLKHLNQFAEFHNTKLQQAIRELEKDHPHVTIVYADYYSAFREVLKHANSLGFDKNAIQKVCCGIGNNEYNFDLNRMCGSSGVVACEHPSQHLFWDGIHLTQHAYQLMAEWLLQHNFMASPLLKIYPQIQIV